MSTACSTHLNILPLIYIEMASKNYKLWSFLQDITLVLDANDTNESNRETCLCTTGFLPFVYQGALFESVFSTVRKSVGMTRNYPWTVIIFSDILFVFISTFSLFSKSKCRLMRSSCYLCAWESPFPTVIECLNQSLWNSILVSLHLSPFQRRTT
jgi:hypothetical protein